MSESVCRGGRGLDYRDTAHLPKGLVSVRIILMIKKIFTISLLWLAALCHDAQADQSVFSQSGITAASSISDIVIRRLRCEYLSSPQGIDVARPRLSWVLNSKTRGQKQTAFQVIASSSEKKLRGNLGDLWDSGKAES